MPEQQFTGLPGSHRNPIAAAHIAERANGEQLVHLAVRVRPKTPYTRLQAAITEIYAAPAAERTYLTREKLAETHGAAQADLDAIQEYARACGVGVSRRRAGERMIVLSGTLETMLRAFPADVLAWRTGHALYRRRQGSLKIPVSLAGIITGLFGYDSRPKQRARHAAGLAPRAAADTGNGVLATAYARRYNFPSAYAGTPLDGTGTCIGIIELGGRFRADDLQAYCARIGSRVPAVVCMPPDRAAPAQSPVGDGDAEVMLDVQIAAAIAPGARIAVYFADNENSGFLQAVSAAVHDATANPNVLSISWGGPECLLDAQSQLAFSEIFTAAAALGMVVCAASGDHGVADFDALHWDNGVHVDHPAADPLVLACGGTQIDAATGNEIVWNDGSAFDITAQAGGWASGGGISTCQDVPAYQQRIALPATLDPSGKAGRGVPDLAMLATNHLTILGGAAIASRGTSAVAPLMAGLVARLAQAHGGNVGFLNTLLYAAAEVCAPVQAGDNGIADTIKGYRAGAGWNACTGLGVPDGVAILGALLGGGRATV